MRVGTRRSPAVTKATTTRTTERLRLRGNLCVLWATACAVACAPPPAPAVHASPAPAPLAPLHRGPLTDFVPAASLRWLILVKPQELLSEPELGPAIQQIVPSVRWDAFAESSGVDLRAVPAAAIAGFPYSTLYLAEVPNGVAAVARERFGERLLAGAVTKRPWPALVRVTGVIGQTPETLLTFEDRIVAVAVGDPVQAKIAEAYAEERLKNSPTALRGAALSSLPALETSDVAALYAPGPFAEEWQRAAGGILQSAVALAITVQPIGHGKVATTLYLAGAWDDSADEAAQRLSAAWAAFAHSSAGHLFELNEVVTVSANPDMITLRVELELDAVVRGLRASVLGDLSQILRLPGKTPTEPLKRAPANPSQLP